MTNEEIIEKTVAFVKETLQGAEGGHDWWHIQRVWRLAKYIATKEGNANILVVELGALLHDIADAKFHGGDESIAPAKARAFLLSVGVGKDIIEHVENIIKYISFKGGNFSVPFTSPELCIVQDADRLDALGAIGIARAFNYGGFKQRELYNPNIAPNLHMTREEYKNSHAPTLNHFYEKLLLLKDRMNTPTAWAMALERHQFMEQFLQQFLEEWQAGN